MILRILNKCLILLACTTLSSLAYGTDLLVLNDHVKVYSKPNVKSSLVAKIRQGAVVQVSDDKIPGFQKVTVKTNKGLKTGYIYSLDLAAPKSKKQAAASKSEKKEKSVGMQDHFAIGLTGGIDYQNQGARTVTLSDGTVTNLSSLSGASLEYGVLAQIPLKVIHQMAVRVFLLIQNTSNSGTASVVTPAGVTAVNSQTLVNEQFINFGLMPMYYLTPFIWVGGGIQIQRGQSGTFTINGFSPVALSGSLLPNFTAGFAAVGLDFPLAKEVYLTPEFHIGGVFTTPVIIQADVLLNLIFAL